VPQVLKFDRLRTPTQTFGVVSDTHICNLNQRLDVAEMAYDEFDRRGVKKVFHLGNMLDGYLERINGGEVLFRNCTDQCIYLADNYPQRAGIETMFITGECHEGWYSKQIGLNIGHHMEDECRRQGRTDLKYVGHVERDVEIPYGTGAATLRLFHPGAGSAYAMSYKPQKIVESYQGGEKPQILLLGHYHKMGYFYPREVHVMLVPCMEDQTRWMRKSQIAAHVGFAMFHVSQDEGGGISKFVPEYFPFYDRGYHVDAGDVWMGSLMDALKAA
jgi:predicted phosphodiesterase